MYFIKKCKNGFALAEVVAALFFVTLVIVLIGGIANQVMVFSKKTKQISGVLELRNKTSAMIKDPETWLQRMRTVVAPTGGAPIAFSSCLPAVNDPASTVFRCPTDFYSDAELDDEPGLKDLTDGGVYKVMSTPIVDSAGVQVAGDANNPLYMSNDGILCTSANPSVTCPLRAVGYFLRQNVGATTNPGNVKFAVKVEMNPGATLKDMTPMKAQYMSMSLGTSWTNTSVGTCALPKVFKGIQPDGSPRCEDPQVPCAAGTIQVGYSTTGPICENISDQKVKCETNEKVILDPVQGKLLCSSASPCEGTGSVFTGFYSGSGEPMCSSSTPCAQGTLQMGTASGSSTPVCKKVEICDPLKEAVTYNGSEFDCVAGREIAGSDGKDGADGTSGSGGTGLSCNVTRKKSGGRGGTVCCDGADEVAMAGTAPDDGDTSFGFNNDSRCLSVYSSGDGDRLELRCCKQGNGAGATSWTNVDLADTQPFNVNCSYRMRVQQTHPLWLTYYPPNAWYDAHSVSPDYLTAGSEGMNIVYITDKNKDIVRRTDGGVNRSVLEMQRLCQ